VPKGDPLRSIHRTHAPPLRSTGSTQFIQTLHAAAEQGPDRHVDDLLALNPGNDELLAAAHWTFSHDGSPGFRLLVCGLLCRSEPPFAAVADVWNDAASAALAFWQRVASDLQISEDGTEVSREKLSRYQAVVFYTAIHPTDIDQEALITWVREGGAFIGIHSTANTFQKNPEFGEMLGAFYDRRPWRTPTTPQVKVRVKVNDRVHPATQHLPETFEIADDIYQFKRFDPSTVNVLLSLDPASLDLENPKVNRADQHFPVSWTKHYGNGRVFYTALGDWEPVWQDPRYRTHLIQGIKWAMAAVEKN